MTLQDLLGSIEIKKVSNGKVKIGVNTPIDAQKFFVHVLGLPEVATNPAVLSEAAKLGPSGIYAEVERMYTESKRITRLADAGYSNIMQGTIDKILTCVPFCDYKTGKIGFFHPDSQTPMSVDVNLYMALRGVSKGELMASSNIGKIEFDPMNLRAVETRIINGSEALILNSHIPPNWRKATPRNSAECPSLIMRLLTNVFPDDKSLKYVLGWIKQSVVGKNETILCLVGPRGVGKTTITGLVSCGVGKHYTSQADGAFLDEKFTSSELEEKRLTILEEVTLDSRKRIDKLKRVTNMEVKIEAKGEDAKTAKSYTSFIVVNNHLNQMPISSEERRFSIVEIGTRNLTSVMTHEEIEELVEAFNRNQEEAPHQLVVDFYHWILEQDFEFNNVVPFKGRYYQEVVFESLPLIEREVIELILEKPNQEFTIKDFKKHLKNKHGNDKIHINVDMLRKFLDNYSFKGMFKVGKLEAKWDYNRNKQYTIVPSQEMTDYANSQIPEEDKAGDKKPGGVLSRARAMSKANSVEVETEEDDSEFELTESELATDTYENPEDYL